LKNNFFLNKYLIAFLLIVVSFTSLYKIYGEVMVSPNSYMLSSEGEATRVYYVFASHAKVDSSYVNFQGMNYPYGEHIIFCDAQPLVANTFRFFTQTFPSIIDYAVGVQNVLSLYGLILGVVLLYIFLLRWKISAWYAALVAYSLMMISPQVLRMPWQPSLAYFFFIPLILLLFQQYFRAKNLKWTIIIFLTVLLSYFLNPYLGIIGTLFFGLIMLSILYIDGWKNLKIYGYGFLQSLLPGILYQLYGKLTDVRVDRVDMPTGLHEFVATFPTIFASPFTPLKSFYESLGANMITLQQHFEGMAYVGFSTSLLVLFFLALIIKNKKLITITIEQRILIVSAILFFVLAIGFPFVFHPSLEKLLEIFKPLRQLRALGRMAWMVPFCINLVVFSMLYFLIKRSTINQQLKALAYGVSICLILFTSYEGSYLHEEVNTNQRKGNTFLREDLKNSIVPHIDEALNNIDPSKYSAIVPIPYFHVGSELFVTKSHTSYTAMLEVISFAYHANLPLTACYLSRISVEESKRAFQFFAPSMIEKTIAKDIKSDQPFLFFLSKSAPKPSDEEMRILKLGKVIYETDLLTLIEVNQNEIWKTNHEEIASWYNEFKNIYTQKDNFFYFGDVEPYYNPYASLDNNLGMDGSGLVIESEEQSYIFNQEVEGKELKQGNYELSFWFETSLNRMQATLVVEKVDKNGKVISSTELHEAKRSFTIKGDWIRLQQSLTIEDDHFVRLYFKQPSNTPGLIIDDLLLVPEKSSVFIKKTEKNWSWNNYPITMN